MICVFKPVYYCQLMYLRAFKIFLEIYELDPALFLFVAGFSWQAALKKDQSKIGFFKSY